MEGEKMKKIRKGKGFCLPGGYRYCGPGCSGPGAPINYVDSCCKMHDDCIARHGSNCRCDKQLIECVQRKTNERTQEGSTARLISGFMKLRTDLKCPTPRRTQRRR